MKRAFTLIEILIATAITAVLIALLALVNTSASQTWQAVNERSSQLQDLITVRQSLGKIIRNAVPYFHDNKDDFYNAFLGEPERFRLASIQRINDLSEGGMLFTELSVQDEKLVMNYKSQPWNDDFAEDLKQSVLLENVSKISCSYAYTEEGRDISWTDSWVEEEHDILPLGIQISITFLNEDTEHFLWRTAGNSRYERWEKLGEMYRNSSLTQNRGTVR